MSTAYGNSAEGSQEGSLGRPSFSASYLDFGASARSCKYLLAPVVGVLWTSQGGSLIDNGRPRRGASSEEQTHFETRTGRHLAQDSQKKELYKAFTVAYESVHASWFRQR